MLREEEQESQQIKQRPCNISRLKKLKAERQRCAYTLRAILYAMREPIKPILGDSRLQEIKDKRACLCIFLVDIGFTLSCVAHNFNRTHAAIYHFDRNFRGSIKYSKELQSIMLKIEEAYEKIRHDLPKIKGD